MNKPHALMRIKAKLENTPHLIDQSSFNQIMDYIKTRADVSPNVKPEAWYDDDDDRPSKPIDPHAKYYNKDTKTAVMHIDGPLTAKNTGWEAFCGGTSYEGLKRQMEAFVSYGATTVAMIQDSGGGEAHGMMDSANYVRKLATDNGIRLISYVDGMSASASYGWSCVADEIIMSADSQVGSIGVLIQLYNNSKQLEMNGIERTFITAGKDKVPYDKDGKFTEAFTGKLKEQVDVLYEAFTSHVADHREMSQDDVKSTEANVFLAKDAIKLGLADRIMTVEEFHSYLATPVVSTKADATAIGTLNARHTLTTEEVQKKMDIEELKTAMKAQETQLSALAGNVTALTASLTAKSADLDKALAEIEGYKTAELTSRQESRKASLSAVLPEDQVGANLTALAGLDDASFKVVVGSMKANKDALAASFKELGGEGAQLEQEEQAQEQGEDPITKAALARIAAGQL